MKFSILLYFTMLFVANDCLKDFFFDDEINVVLNDVKNEAVTFKTTEQVLIIENSIFDGSGEGSGGSGEGSGGMNEEFNLSTAEVILTSLVPTEEIPLNKSTTKRAEETSEALSSLSAEEESSTDSFTAGTDEVMFTESTEETSEALTSLSTEEEVSSTDSFIAATDEVMFTESAVETSGALTSLSTEEEGSFTDSFTAATDEDLMVTDIEDTTSELSDLTNEFSDAIDSSSLGTTKKTVSSEEVEVNSVTPESTIGESTIVSSELYSPSSVASALSVNWTTISTDSLISTKETTQFNGGSTHKYVSIRVCTKDFVCKIGVRGPCNANETLVIDESASSTSNRFGLTCSAFTYYPWKDCAKAKRIGSSINNLLTGKCVQTANLCDSSHMHGEGRKRCPSTSKFRQTPLECGLGQTFVGIPFIRGWCQCTNRQFLPYIGDGSCYRPYTQGPCQYGEWLVPSRKRMMHCQACPCPEKADGKHFYWPGDSSGASGCYQAFTTGPCPDGGIFVISDFLSGKAYCSLSKN